MRGSRGLVGIALGLGAGLAFGAGGVFVKPLLESGWSPGAAVLARISIAAVLLAIPGLIALRFDLRPLWRARWTVLLYGTVAVAGVQFAVLRLARAHPRLDDAPHRVPRAHRARAVRLAPHATDAAAHRARRLRAGDRRARARIGPGGGDLDPLGLIFAAIAMIGVCVYYAIGESATDHCRPWRSSRRVRRRRHRPRDRRRGRPAAHGGDVHRRAVPRRHRAVVGAAAHRRRPLDRVRVPGRRRGHPHARRRLVVPRPLRGRLRRASSDGSSSARRSARCRSSAAR